jgi:glycosyltransferase involved in cell wall biosynthesis
MLVSIVVPFHNEGKAIRDLMHSLLNLSFENEYEIIFVDDASTDDSSKIVADLIKKVPVKCKYVRLEKRRGSFYARNRGIELAEGEIVAFIDADMIPDRNWLKYLVEPLVNNNVEGVCGKTIPAKEDIMIEAVKVAPFGEELAYGFGSGNVAYRKDVLLAVGGFDERFDPKFRGDTDLGCRILKAGGKIVYEPRAIAYHPIKEIPLIKLWNYAKGHIHDPLFYKKHKDIIFSYENIKKTLGSKFTQPFIGPISLLGLTAIILLGMLITLAYVSILFLLNVMLSLIILWVAFFVKSGYKFASSIPKGRKVELKLRFKASIHILLYMLFLFLFRAYGSFKYKQFFI